jgi:tol-pal system protein YbgF
MKRLGFFIIVLFIAFVTNCASTDDVGRLQYEMQELKTEVRKLKRASDVKIEGRVNERLRELEEQQKATGDALTDLLMEVQSLKTDLQVLTGRFEEARYFSEKNAREFKQSRDELFEKLKEMEIMLNSLQKKLGQGGTEKTVPPAETDKMIGRGKKKEKKASKDEKVVKDVKEAYMEAYQAYKSNDMETAREMFNAVLENYPENEFSDNARFWIGETYYREKRYEDAILAYDELLKKNPKSDKVSGALLKQGLAFHELKRDDLARTILEDLIRRYPDTKQAQIAKRKLALIKPKKDKK